MIKYALLFSAMIFMFTSCAQVRQTDDRATQLESEHHQAFLGNLASLCGKSFKGKQVYRSHHGASWAEKTMIMHVAECQEGHIYIPFHIDDDTSRTWMFLVEDGKLRFRHQHLHEDGTHEDDSMYGGYADDRGDAFTQYFPADEFTAGVIEEGGGNLWIVNMDEELNYFSYRLDRDGEKRFEIVFDLNNPIE
jgi:hypothetical protein